MSTWIKVARYQLTDRYVFLISPWLILSIGFLINLVIVANYPGRQGQVYVGALSAIYIVLLTSGALAIARQLPFALALGVSRRSFYAGTALLALAIAAVFGLALTILQLIERGTGGWGLKMHFFRVPYLLAGPWYLSWLTSFVGLTLMLAWGIWFGIVYRRWNLAGLLSFIAVQALALTAVLLMIAGANDWHSVARFFTTLTIGGLTGLLAALFVAGRDLAARLVRWWIAAGRYSEAGQFLSTAAGVAAAAAPGIQARVMLGAAWSALHLGDTRRAAPLAADGIACSRQAGEPRLEVWGRLMLAGLAWHAGDADRIVAELEASRVLSGQADPALATRAQGLLAMAAFLSGDLAEQERHGLAAVELARTAAGQEGLALALSMWSMPAIAGAGIQPATSAALEEAANLTAAHPDSFTETAMHHWRAVLFATLDQLEAAETQVGLCWAAGRSGAVRLVEVAGPLAEARLAASGDTATAISALRRAADGGRRVGSVMYVPAALAHLACMAAIAGD